MSIDTRRVRFIDEPARYTVAHAVYGEALENGLSTELESETVDRKVFSPAEPYQSLEYELERMTEWDRLERTEFNGNTVYSLRETTDTDDFEDSWRYIRERFNGSFTAFLNGYDDYDRELLTRKGIEFFIDSISL